MLRAAFHEVYQRQVEVIVRAAVVREERRVDGERY